MNERTLDARGMLCPRPLMLVKQALEEAEAGTRLVVLLDNDTACANVTRFLRDNQAEPVASQEGSEYTIRAQKSAVEAPALDPAAYCEPVPGGPLVMAFTGNTMGRGSGELGRLLIQACLNALPEVEPGPEVLIFYNSGVELVAEGSAVLTSLQKLADKGVRILVCGTCADFFGVKDRLRVGLISNMYEILETLCGASKVIYP